MNVRLLRLFFALLLYVAIFGVVWLLIGMVGSGEDAVSEQVRRQFSARPGQLDGIREDAVALLRQWAFFAMGVSWLAAAFWLFLADLYRPKSPSEATDRTGAWVGLFFLSMASAGGIFWMLILQRAVLTDLAAGVTNIAMGAVGLALLLTYWLATGLFVKITMQPSVPLSGPLPNLVRSRS
jgi:hypothetical protein